MVLPKLSDLLTPLMRRQLRALGIRVRKMTDDERQRFGYPVILVNTKAVDLATRTVILGSSELLFDPYEGPEKLRDLLEQACREVMGCAA